MQLKIFVGKEKIRNRLFTHSLSWWHNGKRSELCIAKIKCNEAIKTVLHRLRTSKEHHVIMALDPIHVHLDKSLLAKLCRYCKPEATGAYNKGRAKLFEALPSILCEVAGGWDDSDLEDDF